MGEAGCSPACLNPLGTLMENEKGVSPAGRGRAGGGVQGRRRLLVTARGGRGRPGTARGTARQTPSRVQGQGRWCHGRLLAWSLWATSPPGNVAADPLLEAARQYLRWSGQGCSQRHGGPGTARATSRQTPSSLLVTARGGRGRLLVSARGGRGRPSTGPGEHRGRPPRACS